MTAGAPGGPDRTQGGGGLPRRRRMSALTVGIAVLALAAHFAWSYLPRVRAGRPAADGPAARLLAAAEGGRAGEAVPAVALWIAYPHQNLAALERGLGEDAAERDRFLAAAARLAGLPELELPRFGPFAAPPSRELIAVSDVEGRRVLVAARIYPAVAVLARLAGAVAGNPWLSGGEVDAFGGRARVAWDGLRWSVASAGGEEILARLGELGPEDEDGPAGDGGRGDDGGASETTEPPGPDGPALAILALGEPLSILPVGRHRLVAEGGDLVLANAGAADLPAVAPDLLAGSAVSVLAISGPGGPLAGEGDRLAAAAVALFPADGTGRGLSLRGFLRRAVAVPGAAVWYRPGLGEPGPARRLLAPLFSGGRARDAGGDGASFALVATGGDSLARARRLTPTVEGLAGDLRFGLWVAPRAAFAAVDPVVDLLEKVPLVPRDDLARWRDWRTVLAPLAGYESVSLLAAGDDLRLRLER